MDIRRITQGELAICWQATNCLTLSNAESCNVQTYSWELYYRAFPQILPCTTNLTFVRICWYSIASLCGEESYRLEEKSDLKRDEHPCGFMIISLTQINWIQWNLPKVTTYGPTQSGLLIERWPLDTVSIISIAVRWDFFEWPLERGGGWTQVLAKAGFTVLDIEVNPEILNAI